MTNENLEDTLELDEQMNNLVAIAMDIILNAGNAREKSSEAVKAIKLGKADESETLMKEANDYIVKAHQSQTKVIQDEAAGNSWPYLLLFTHAQDTLMTIMSEIKMSKELIAVYTDLNEIKIQLKELI